MNLSDYLECLNLGIFQVEWLKNDEPLRFENAHKYQIVGNGTALKIKSITFADTGAYMCQATNVGK